MKTHLNDELRFNTKKTALNSDHFVANRLFHTAIFFRLNRIKKSASAQATNERNDRNKNVFVLQFDNKTRLSAIEYRLK